MMRTLGTKWEHTQSSLLLFFWEVGGNRRAWRSADICCSSSSISIHQYYNPNTIIIEPNYMYLFHLKRMFVFFRDESASATFYYKEKREANQSHHASRESFRPVSDNLVEEWMYYRPIKTGESEFLLRNKQVRLPTLSLLLPEP